MQRFEAAQKTKNMNGCSVAYFERQQQADAIKVLVLQSKKLEKHTYLVSSITLYEICIYPLTSEKRRQNVAQL